MLKIGDIVKINKETLTQETKWYDKIYKIIRRDTFGRWKLEEISTGKQFPSNSFIDEWLIKVNIERKVKIGELV